MPGEPAGDCSLSGIPIVLGASGNRVCHVQHLPSASGHDLRLHGERLLLAGVMLPPNPLLLGARNLLLRGVPEDFLEVGDDFLEILKRGELLLREKRGKLRDDPLDGGCLHAHEVLQQEGCGRELRVDDEDQEAVFGMGRASVRPPPRARCRFPRFPFLRRVFCPSPVMIVRSSRNSAMVSLVKD